MLNKWPLCIIIDLFTLWWYHTIILHSLVPTLPCPTMKGSQIFACNLNSCFRYHIIFFQDLNCRHWTLKMQVCILFPVPRKSSKDISLRLVSWNMIVWGTRTTNSHHNSILDIIITIYRFSNGHHNLNWYRCHYLDFCLGSNDHIGFESHNYREVSKDKMIPLQTKPTHYE